MTRQEISSTMFVMRENNGHKIKQIIKNSIAERLGIEAGDWLLEMNGQKLEDIFDYQYQVEDCHLRILLRKQNGEEHLLEVEKDEDEDLGIIFENGLMDAYRSCHNKCIFCFIDQMPKGMRENLYFKDDDSRLSFLQGNYVTLTNMSDHDLDRIIQYRLSPINISFQTMNPDLRCKMLNNRFAGEALKKADRLYEAGIGMNGQIVLCKGVNDGKELEYSIRRLMEYIPVLESVSVVPVGLSKFRDDLYPLEPFTREDAKEVLAMIHDFQRQCVSKYGIHFIHASDEWYILANEPIPEEESYDGYLQLENGVGMIRLLLDEFQQEMDELKKHRWLNRLRYHIKWKGHKRKVSLATGKLAYPYLASMAEQLQTLFPLLEIRVYEIINHFFGEQITVSGLIVGEDLIGQLKGKELGDRLLIPQNMVRVEENVFLDDVTVREAEKTLQVSVDIVKSSGCDFIDSILGRNTHEQE